MSASRFSVRQQILKYPPLIMGLLISLCFAYYALLTPLNERKTDWKLYDFYNTYQVSLPSTQNIIIIDIDDSSIETLGQWPWPRYRLAEAIRLILKDRPASLIVDILLSEKDRTSLINIHENFATEFGVHLDLSNVPTALKDYDAYFSKVIKNTPVVLASMLSKNKVTKEGLCADNMLKNANLNKQLQQLTPFKGIICPLDNFYKNSASTGVINASIDNDGLLRRVPILMQYDGNLFPSLSLSGLMVLLGSEIEFGKNTIGNFVSVSGRQIPIDNNGNALLNFRGKARHFETIPILKLLSGVVPVEHFTGKIVLLGATASALNDIVSTPLDLVFPGIEAQATLIDNVLNDDVLKTPIWFETLEAICLLLFGALISILIVRKKVIIYSLSSLLIVTILLIAPPIILYYSQVYISPFLSLINLISVFIVASVFKYYTAEQNLVSVLKSISLASLSIIDSMATVAELRDSETGGHIIRTRLYVKAMAEHLQKKDKYKREMSNNYIRYICAAAPLHDIGKVGIPDNILLKPGKLTTDELVIMRTHATLGGKILKQTQQKVGSNPYIEIAIEIANCHHEKWDGNGYPVGLQGEEIPLSARIMAIADVFDALVNRRVYKEAMSFEETINIIKKGSGNHFDPEMVNAFLEIKDDLIAIAKTIKD